LICVDVTTFVGPLAVVKSEAFNFQLTTTEMTESVLFNVFLKIERTKPSMDHGIRLRVLSINIDTVAVPREARKSVFIVFRHDGQTFAVLELKITHSHLWAQYLPVLQTNSILS
jgi:hypothetical protein